MMSTTATSSKKLQWGARPTLIAFLILVLIT
jgi:hypothetical protein